MVAHFSPPEKNIFFEEEKMSDYFGEDENNPKWNRCKAHFTD
jgi:hypothetical protein